MTFESTRSSPNRLSTRDLLVILTAVLFICGLYLFASHLVFGIGFPLDDSWIHQTYARNLAEHGEWAFRPGVTSAGSTSPLWSALLALGFRLNLSPYLWTYFLGGLVLFSLAVTCDWSARKLIQTYQPRFPWIGAGIALEWHLTWAAMSGMETLLHGLIITSVLILLMTGTRRFLILGLLTGLAAWVRPDGVTLLVPVTLVIAITEGNMRARAAALSRYLIGFGSLFVPYLLFNLAVGGTPMPNTFYAKQAEYAAWQQLSIFTRGGQMLLQLLAGPGLVLFPGSVIWLIRSARQRDWGSLLALAWCAGYFVLYILRLPVYQHGRYIMPAMPVLFLTGFFALADFDADRLLTQYHRLAQVAWRSSVALLLAGFVVLGARSYAEDVHLIESEMVVTAKWVAESLPPDALLAAHDIGALGYFDDHELIDLAGLISPEVIPFIRDEARLAAYLDQRGADYLIAFPDFYPQMTDHAEILFITNSPLAQELGRENMAVYRWKSP
jgi:hypothetical protein